MGLSLPVARERERSPKRSRSQSLERPKTDAPKFSFLPDDHRVRVANLPNTMTEEDLIEFCKTYAKLSKSEIVIATKKTHETFALINLSTADAVAKLIDSLSFRTVTGATGRLELTRL